LDRMINVIPKIEPLLEDLKTQQIKVAAVISDSTPAYVAAQEIFKENPHFNNAIKKVVEITNYFNNSNHSYFIARLHEVLHTFSYLYKLMDEYSDITFGIKMMEHLERHRREREQPLLILSYLLYPDIRLSQFNLSINSISFAELGRWDSELDDDELLNESNREDKENSSQLYDDNDDNNNLDITKLEGLFVLDMVAPHYIVEAEIQEILRKQKEIEFIRNEIQKKVETENIIESSMDSNSEESD
ncbi:4704_t:CDS:2, partial [Scutellospora calospora]